MIKILQVEKRKKYLHKFVIFVQRETESLYEGIHDIMISKCAYRVISTLTYHLSEFILMSLSVRNSG